MKDLLALLKAGFGAEVWRDTEYRCFNVQVYKDGTATNYRNRSLRKALREAAEENLPKESQCITP